MSLAVEKIGQQDVRLGRQKVHDSRSRAFPLSLTVDRSTWRDKSVRIYDPYPNPNQCHGECTGVAKAMQFNAVGNRKSGQVLKMGDAHQFYGYATRVDPWEGAWPPDDTGSSGLASAKAAQFYGFGGNYYWLFGGADEVIQAIMSGQVISVGTWWYWDMFDPGPENVVVPSGGRAGGHQWVVRGYDNDRDQVLGRCWWGGFRDFWISRQHLDDLLFDGGDAHWQART